MPRTSTGLHCVCIILLLEHVVGSVVHSKENHLSDLRQRDVVDVVSNYIAHRPLATNPLDSDMIVEEQSVDSHIPGHDLLARQGAHGKLEKRQIWNMDYGWGGRRFGKRSVRKNKQNSRHTVHLTGMVRNKINSKLTKEDTDKSISDSKQISDGKIDKREILDYGWGGRRFGKRGVLPNNLATPNKREILDYGWGGRRFGKRGVSSSNLASPSKREILDYGWGGRRFGKRGILSGNIATVNKREILDYGWGGRRFGKRQVLPSNLKVLNKREILNYGWGGRRFGKRGILSSKLATPNKREILDYGWGGRRFGKRENSLSVIKRK